MVRSRRWYWGCIVERGRGRALQNWELLFLGDLEPAFVIDICLFPVRFLPYSYPENGGLGWAECLEPGPKVTHSEEKQAKPAS